MTRRSARRVGSAASPARWPDLLGSRLRIAGLAIVCAKVALVPIVFDQAADVPFTVPKALVSHALAYALAGVLAGLWVQYGRALLVRSWLHVAALAFLGANALAAVFAADRFLALYGTHDRMIGLATIADGVLLYFAVALLIRRRAEAVAVVLSFFAGSAVVLAYAFVQFSGRDPLSWSVDGAIRPFSTLGQTTNLAEYLTVVAAGAAALALFEAKTARRWRVALGIYSVLVFAGVVVTQTRSAFLGIVSAAAVLLLLTWAAHPSPRARVASVVGALGAAIVLGAVLVFTPLGARLLSTVEISATAEGEAGARFEEAADVRLSLYRAAVEMVRDRPALGYGPDNFLASFPRYRAEDEPLEVQESPNTSAHGWLAQVAATSGLIGLVAFIAICAVALVLTLRTGFRPVAWASLGMLAAFLGAGLTTVNGAGTDWLFWAASGGVAASTGSPTPTPAAPARGRPKTMQPPRLSDSRRLAGLACAGLGVALMLTTLSAFDATRAARASQVARLQGRGPEAVQHGLRATGSDPLRAQYWDALGLAYVSADRLRDAATAFERANELAPYDVRYHGDLARAYVVLTQRGDASAGARARDVAERAVATDPNNPLANLTRAVVMQVTGDLPEALRSVERALDLDKRDNRDIYLTGTQVLLRMERPSEAIAMARRGIPLIPVPLNQVTLRIELARALAANGQRAEALAELDTVLAIRPNEPTAVQLRSQIQAGVTR